MAQTPLRASQVDDAADLDFLNAVLLEHLGIVGHEHMVGIEQHLAGLGRHDGLGRVAAVDALAEALDLLSLGRTRRGP